MGYDYIVTSQTTQLVLAESDISHYPVYNSQLVMLQKWEVISGHSMG